MLCAECETEPCICQEIQSHYVRKPHISHAVCPDCITLEELGRERLNEIKHAAGERLRAEWKAKGITPRKGNLKIP